MNQEYVEDSNGNKCYVNYFGSMETAQLIYLESGSPINPCRFYDKNEAAMADMKARAEKG